MPWRVAGGVGMILWISAWCVECRTIRMCIDCTRRAHKAREYRTNMCTIERRQTTLELDYRALHGTFCTTNGTKTNKRTNDNCVSFPLASLFPSFPPLPSCANYCTSLPHKQTNICIDWIIVDEIVICCCRDCNQQIQKEIDRQTDWQTYRQADWQTDFLTGRQASKQAAKQTKKHGTSTKKITGSLLYKETRHCGDWFRE